MGGKIFADVVLDGVADAVFKVMESVFAFLRQGKLRPVQNSFGLGEPCLGQIGKNGLEGEKIGVVPVQNELSDLRRGQREIDAVEHIENHELIKGGRFLIHSIVLV